jgi:exopolysaccharide biosynthesis protein
VVSNDVVSNDVVSNDVVSGDVDSTSEAASSVSASVTTAAAVVTSNSYQDANISITIDTVREYDTDIYIADIQVSSVEYLKTAFAQGTYGRNIKETTSSMASSNNAIFAINGDYYGFRDFGFVLHNGVLYRDTARASGSDEALAIDSTGNMSIINESTTDAQSLVDANVWQVLSFGPALINNGEITVTASSEVGQSMTSNPRTAIGMISPLHYIVIVSDGRTSQSAGLSLLELAQKFANRSCTVAYNLDGGGSSTLWFNGQVVNNPTDGHSNSERSVSDIVYFGY